MTVMTEVEPVADGYRVTTRADAYSNGWGVGVTFPTARGAQMVATAIELAAAGHAGRLTKGEHMQEWTFTGLWPQTEGNPKVVNTHRGVTPIDALVRFWSTCDPGGVLSGPLRCEQDGHIYHPRLTEDGYREITVRARALQFVTETI